MLRYKQQVDAVSSAKEGQNLGKANPQYRYGTKVTGLETTPAAGGWGAFLEELDLPENLREILRAGWRWDFIEPGGDIRTLDSELLNERTDEELLSIPGMTKARLRAVRRAVLKDPGLGAVSGIVQVRPVP
ncbi:MAG: hypothetical protein ABSB57_01990 [Dehalococcoidia bacterium]